MLPLNFFGKDIIHWAPDSKSLVYFTTGLAAQQGFYRVPVGDVAAAPTRLTPFAPLADVTTRHGQGVAWDSLGRTLVGEGFMAENTTVVSSRGDRIIFGAESASEPPELWTADSRFRAVRRISHLSGAVLNVPLGERRIVQWTTAQGQARRGIMLLPAGYRSDVQYPLIVWMYEKSIPTYVNAFGLSGQAFFNLHLFATRGYVSFYPDLTWTKDSVLPSLGEQVHDGVHELARRGIVDSTRVGIVGQSSGGYDVLAVATAYPGVRAGVAVSGIADMVMEFGSTMDDPVGYEWAERQMGLEAPPWEHPERYVLNSPSYHFDRVQASLLLLEGTADDFTRAHMDLAFAELKRLRKPVEYRRYPGEGHVPDDWTPANRLDAERRMLEWFDLYVKASKR